MKIKFNHLDRNNKLTVPREDNFDYAVSMVKRALQSKIKVIIEYPDGTKTVFNPED